MSDNDPNDGAWFETKRYGYGSGLPIAWQGWALLGGFILAAMAVGPLIAQPGVATRIVIGAAFFALLIVFIDIVRRKTRGEWKWRWGSKD